jgi:hypothetical protein
MSDKTKELDTRIRKNLKEMRRLVQGMQEIVEKFHV